MELYIQFRIHLNNPDMLYAVLFIYVYMNVSISKDLYQSLLNFDRNTQDILMNVHVWCMYIHITKSFLHMKDVGWWFS